MFMTNEHVRTCASSKRHNLLSVCLFSVSAEKCHACGVEFPKEGVTILDAMSKAWHVECFRYAPLCGLPTNVPPSSVKIPPLSTPHVVTTVNCFPLYIVVGIPCVWMFSSHPWSICTCTVVNTVTCRKPLHLPNLTN